MERIPDILPFEDELKTFVNSLGITYSNNRFAQNFAEIRNAFSREDKGIRDWSREAHLRHAVAELVELKGIVRTVEKLGVPKAILQNKMKKVLSGIPYVDTPKDTHDESRNITFELGLASFLHKQKTDFEYEGAGDITLHYDNLKIGIECKRLNSDPRKALKNALRKAHRQLLKRRAEIDFGVVALSIENFYFNEGKLVISDTDPAIAEGFYKISRDFIDTYNKMWLGNKIFNDPEFIPAILVCLRGTVYNFKTNFTANAFYVTVNNTSVPTNTSFETLKQITKPWKQGAQ